MYVGASFPKGETSHSAKAAAGAVHAGMRLRTMPEAAKRGVVDATWRAAERSWCGRGPKRRFVQLSTDMNMLRWTRRDFLLLDEVRSHGRSA